MQSGFHNLPTFAGVQQQDGTAFAADEVAVELGQAVSSISMNIAGAYPKDARVAHYRRIVRLIKGDGVEICDDFVGERQAELSLMLRETPRISGSRIAIGDLAELVVSGGGPIRAEEIAITDPRLRVAWPERLYRVLVPIEGRQLRLKIQ